MLYVTTRNQIDVFTAEHTIGRRRAPDGGLYCPFHGLKFQPEEVEQLKEISFSQCMAMMLEKILGKKISSREVDFCIGRHPVRLRTLVNRVTVCETWRNQQWEFRSMADGLARRLGAERAEGWVEIAVRIAVLFGVYGEMRRKELLKQGEEFDIAVLSGSFSEPVSAWYAKRWGLPVGKIVCCCNENNTVWNLICQGQFPTNAVAEDTCVPQADIVLPEELERLICECGGILEMEDYLGCCETGRTYYPEEAVLAELRRDLYVSVVGSQRIRQTISGVYKSFDYVLSPEGALIYSGLQDYRAGKEQLRQAVVMSSRSPGLDGEFVADCLGILPRKLEDRI